MATHLKAHKKSFSHELNQRLVTSSILGSPIRGITSVTLHQGSQTQIDQRATLCREKASRAEVYFISLAKCSLRLSLISFFNRSRAAQTYVFETPVLDYYVFVDFLLPTGPSLLCSQRLRTSFSVSRIFS